MSVNTNSTSNFYEQTNFPTAEIAVLAEEIVIKEPEAVLTSIENVKGKFFVNIMTPTVQKGEPKISITKGMKSTNYIELIIPTYIIFNFCKPAMQKLFIREDGIINTKRGKKKLFVFIANTEEEIIIPKDTKFVIEFQGGSATVDSCRIVGLY